MPEHPTLHNRLYPVMIHLKPYMFFGGYTKLARVVGVSPKAIGRIIRGQRIPSYPIAIKIAEAIEKELGKSVDPRELFSLAHKYPTESTCELTGCKYFCPILPNTYTEYRVMLAGEQPK